MKQVFLTALLALGFMSPGAHAHGDSHAPKTKKSQDSVEEKEFGRPGDPKRVTRTVRIDMDDTMHYSVGLVTVKQGETIRFLARNRGKLVHEMVLGTPADIEEHAELMRKFPDMEHDEEYQLHVQPGTTGEMVWHFTKAGEFKFACLMPGHYEAGMHGKVVVLDRKGNVAQDESRRSGSTAKRT
jgi:uncharacterized cupredoxin-like copper-binding protein